MDAKDLRIETALGERNDGSKYSQSGVALQCSRNKSYQDIGSNPLAKAEVAVRPCAVIGPDRVVPPPATNDANLKKGSVDLWPCPDNLYPRPPEYSHKPLNHVNPSRNISPRQTFQENMQRIMVPPTYNAVKHAEGSNLNHVPDRNAALSKNTKQTMAPQAKYCDVPYTVNLLTNEHKNVRESEMCVPTVNSPLTRTTPHGWPPGGVNLHAPRTYGPHDVFQYQQYPSCDGSRPPTIPMARPHRTFQDDGSGYGYPDSYYQDASVRFKPYPSMKERYPQARYDYISNYPNPFHPPPPYAPHKYDIPNARPPHPYPVYTHLKYLDNRVPDPNIESYQRSSQQAINYNMQFRNQIIHPPYGPALGNAQNKLPSYPPDKSLNKVSLDTSKAFVDYENAKAKYSLPDNYFVNDLSRVHQVQKPVAMPSYASPGMSLGSLQQYHRKDHATMKPYEYMPHYRHFEHPLGFNHSGHHPPQFSPSTLAISPTDSNTSNDTANTQGTSQEDCGYVSQSSTTSARSVDRLHNDYHRRYDYRYRPIMGNSQMLPKSNLTSGNSKEKNKIDVRQFLSMWNEGEEDNSNNNTKEISPQNNVRCQENAKSQDQLYVLGLVNVPSEELAKYEHIQKVSKLPENIKGYNSIELLNQFEEVIESSNINSFKPSTPKEFMSMKDRKNAIRQIVEILPRPVSPLDVEAKISQSVIHKEVGCNFEIKPCSPKMLNVEIAAPVQNILGERAIEKVSNPLLKAKSPLSMRIDGNTNCNKIQRQESTHPTYENLSCKMVGSPFSANNMESVKTNYSLQDLETSSGVCLASLPRLDNEIELNFLEVNQQFINANKGSHNLHVNYTENVKEDSENMNASTDNDKVHNNLDKLTDVVDSCAELTKLSKYRKTKVNCMEYSEDESNANANRTDSVIIENPENVRRIEENKEKTSLPRSVGEDANTPMNLTSQYSSYVQNESDTSVVECALDFSLNKPENGLPLLNTYDDDLNTTQQETLMGNVTSYLSGDSQLKLNNEECPNSSINVSSECASDEANTKSIIVRNDQRARHDYKTNFKDNNSSLVDNENSSLESIENFNSINKEEPKIDNTSKTSTAVKASSTKVIVKHKHKNKSKLSKTKIDVIKQNFEHEMITKGNKIEKDIITSSVIDIHSNKNLMTDSKDFSQKSNSTKSVIQNVCLSDEHSRMELTVSDVYKVKYSETNSAMSNTNNDINLENQLNMNLTTTEITSDNCSKNMNKPATKMITEDQLTQKNLLVDSDRKIHEQSGLINDKNEVLQLDIQTNQVNKYYNDLISESELLVGKAFEAALDLPVPQSSNSSFIHKKQASADIVKIIDSSVKTIDDFKFEQKSDTKNTTDTSDNISEVLKDAKTLEIDASMMTQDVQCHNCSLPLIDQENKQGSIGNDELNINNSFDSEQINNSIKIKVECEEISRMTKNVDMRTTAVMPDNISKQSCKDSKILLDKKYSIDSGYQSNKNSYTEHDEGSVDFPGNSSEDSVFIEQESGNNQIILNEKKDITMSSISMETLQSFADRSNSTSFSKINENITTEYSNQNNKIEIDKVALDDIDANMEVIFAQPNEEILSESVNTDDIEVLVNNTNKNLQNSKDFIIGEPTDMDDYSFETETKTDVIITSLTVDTTDNNMVMTEPCIKSFSTDEKGTEIPATSCSKKYSGYIHKELYSPWIQKLLLFNEGTNNIKSFKCLNSAPFQKLEIESALHNDNVNGKPVVDNNTKSLHSTKINSVLEDILSTDINTKPIVDFCGGKITQNVDIVSLENTKVNSVLENVIEVKQLEEPNIEYKSPEITNINRVGKNNDIEVKSLENSDVDMINKNNDCEDKSFEDTVEVIDSSFDNYDIAGKPLVKAAFGSCIPNVDIVDESLEEPNCESVSENESVDINSLEAPNIEELMKSDDYVKSKSLEIQIVNNIVKVNTKDESGFKLHSVRENDLIEDTIMDIDMAYDNIIPETNTNSINCSKNESNCNAIITMDLKNNMNQEKTIDITVDENSLPDPDNSELENNCLEECNIQNDLIDTQEISFNYPNNSIISQITENIFHSNDSTLKFKGQDKIENEDIHLKNINIHRSPMIHRRSLKRSFSDSALHANFNCDDRSVESSHYSWAPKRNKINESENSSLNYRRNSVNIEENISFCILIDDNCIITEENEEKICITELQEEYITEIDMGNEGDTTDLLSELDCTTHESGIDLTETVVLECENDNPVPWVENITCAEDVFSDEVAENVVISAPSSPTVSVSEYEHDDIDIYGTTSCDHTDKVKFLHGDKMTEHDAQIVDSLYRTPHMNIMNKTLLYGDKTVESDDDQEDILIESDDWKPSPTHTPDYIDPTHASNDFRLETPENKENVFIKDLSPLRRIDDYLDVSSAENENDESILPQRTPDSDKTQDNTVYSCESSLDNVFDYKLKDESINTTTSKSLASSPEVSSTTAEEKNSSILLKITNLNGSRVSQVNEIQMNNRPRCKFTEKKEYSTSSLNFPNRPLITKAAQKYIPPIKESIRDLKVKISLPQQSLIKLKQLKLSRNEPKVHKQQVTVPRIIKKPKPNFDDVLKSIDEIQIKRHKEKSKKVKTVIPKVLIKKNENGSHYASTSKKETFSPDLTGRKWQPWVFLEKNNFIDKMAMKNKTKAIFSHRKKTYVLAEKFKKYKSVSNAKFVISQPKTPGQLKYTIRLKTV